MFVYENLARIYLGSARATCARYTCIRDISPHRRERKSVHLVLHFDFFQSYSCPLVCVILCSPHLMQRIRTSPWSQCRQVTSFWVFCLIWTVCFVLLHERLLAVHEFMQMFAQMLSNDTCPKWMICFFYIKKIALHLCAGALVAYISRPILPFHTVPHRSPQSLWSMRRFLPSTAWYSMVH